MMVHLKLSSDDGPPKAENAGPSEAFGHDDNDGKSMMMIQCEDGTSGEVTITDDSKVSSEPPHKKARMNDIDTECITA